MWRTFESKIGSYAGQDRPARDAEHDLDPERLQRADERLGAGHRLGRHRLGGGRAARPWPRAPAATVSGVGLAAPGPAGRGEPSACSRGRMVSSS